ncbi:MAG TPA: type II secretion system minor pseudopilin GspK [Steroidobacteraceae bacterium]
MRPAQHPARQRGVALIAAILLVALGTIVAASIAFNNAMAARRGTSNLSLDQSLLVAEAAEALAAYALREDLRDNPNQDHPHEAWSNRLGPVEVVPGVFLEAIVEDQHGRFNLNSLVNDDGSVNGDMVEVFRRLLQKLDIEPTWAQLIADWIDPDIVPLIPDGGEDSLYTAQTPPYRPPNMYITSPSELLALPGFGRERYLKLAPYITALPHTAKLNTCSARGHLLDAMIADNHEEYGGDPEKLAKNREQGCFPTKTQYQASFDAQPDAWQKMEPYLAETSSYFRLTSIVSIGTSEFALYSLLLREQGGVRPILRSFAAE